VDSWRVLLALDPARIKLRTKRSYHAAVATIQPEGLEQISPGQRPGDGGSYMGPSPERARQLLSGRRLLRPFRARKRYSAFDSQGVALG
jgi:hypothetical protein